MKYKSSNGTLFYYDSVLHIWKHANPTMLFLLGFESVTTYDNIVSDNILISKLVNQRYNNDVVSLEYFDIFDDIYSYLSSINQTEDFDSYLTSSLNGLKLFLNSLTGTTSDRTIPLIFRNDSNSRSINLNSPMYRLPESERLSKSYLDLQAQKICDIFEDAGYDRNRFLLYRKARRFLVDHVDDSDNHQWRYMSIKAAQYDSFISREINEFNDLYYPRYQEIVSNKDIYCKLDYAAMYSYALGVLYGCVCLNYSYKAIFKIEPINWYNGEYFNLVNTAWHCFRFGYSQRYLNKDDVDNYVSIRENKLKNFSDLSNGVTFHNDDLLLCNAYIDRSSDSPELVVDPIIYSESTDTGSETHPGSYARLVDYDLQIFSPIDNIISEENNETGDIDKGVISTDDLITMYISSDAVKIYRAYAYKEPDVDQFSGNIDFSTGSYLSPNNDTLHFVPTGDLGWIHFNEDEWRSVHDNSYNLIHPNTLSLMPMSFNQLPADYSTEVDENDNVIKKYSYFGKAINRESGDIVTYYKCLVTCLKHDEPGSECTDDDHIYLYGIFDGRVNFESSKIVFPDNQHFKSILSNVDFENNYAAIDGIPEGWSEQVYYDIADEVILLTDGNQFYILVDDSLELCDLVEFGYTDTKSVRVQAYVDQNSSPTEYDLRYNSQQKYGYWSSDWDPKRWTHSPTENDIYILRTDLARIYQGEICLGDFTSYYSLNDSSRNANIYIYNDGSLDFASTIGNGFVLVGSYESNRTDTPSLYNKSGVTEYLCSFVMKDSSGNYLTDDRTENGVPLVWYDNISNLYWNGLYSVNRWQTMMPSLDSSIMYRADIEQYIQVIDDTDNRVISIDGSTNIPYDDFYSDPTRGIVRYKLKVFNSTKTEGIIDCLVDDKNDPNHPENAIYCIPGVTPTWVSRGEILPDYGYRFVDGMAALYTGADRVDVVIDDDDTD